MMKIELKSKWKVFNTLLTGKDSDGFIFLSSKRNGRVEKIKYLYYKASGKPSYFGYKDRH